ncbi:hypothetical protein ACRRTK_000085 [Alexandromys fortis]
MEEKEYEKEEEEKEGGMAASDTDCLETTKASLHSVGIFYKESRSVRGSVDQGYFIGKDTKSGSNPIESANFIFDTCILTETSIGYVGGQFMNVPLLTQGSILIILVFTSKEMGPDVKIPKEAALEGTELPSNDMYKKEELNM